MSLLAALVLTPLIAFVPAGADEDPNPAQDAVHTEGVTFPVGPGAFFTLLSTATTEEPLDIQTSVPSEIEFARVSIPPDGTMGLTRHKGTALANVIQGTASVLAPEDGRCAAEPVGTGLAFIEAREASARFATTDPRPSCCT